MTKHLTKSQVLRVNAAFREQVKHLASVAMNECGVVWRDLDIDEIAIAAVNKMRLYERVCRKLGVVELGDSSQSSGTLNPIQDRADD